MANLTWTLSGTREWAFDLPVLELRDGAVHTVARESFRVVQGPQIMNIADFCNECGNCTTFCPTAGDPYKDKPRLCLTEASLAQEPNGILIRGSVIRAREGDAEHRLEHRDGLLYYEGPSAFGGDPSGGFHSGSGDIARRGSRFPAPGRRAVPAVGRTAGSSRHEPGGHPS
jgi:ferredoxin